MYNSVTEELIKQIPKISTIETETLPQKLTEAFAEIVELRKKVATGDVDLSPGLAEKVTTLRKLGNNLETLLSCSSKRPDKESVAFVAATSHHLLLRISRILGREINPEESFTADYIDSAISGILLFLIADSPADASEISNFLEEVSDPQSIKDVLFNFIRWLAKGQLSKIENAVIPVISDDESNLNQALHILWMKLAEGIQVLVKELLGQPFAFSAKELFEEVIDLSSESLPAFGNNFEPQSLFAGPYHLAKLFKILSDDFAQRGIINTPPPTGISPSDWKKFLTNIAVERPLLWNNHFEAVTTNFLNPGVSAVLTFPTGSGKSTLSELKIASALYSGGSVVYLVPTHALEDQVKKSLENRFEEITVNKELDIDQEYTEIGIDRLPNISVMTPERCLTLIGIDQELFSDVKLLVFDEFHLIHGKSENLNRRSIDAMFCLLSLFAIIPDSDYMLISAMVENSSEIADWVKKVTNRDCINFNSSWKPTRQLQGCIVYNGEQHKELEGFIRKSRRDGISNSQTQREILATPLGIYSLRNMWETTSGEDYHILQLIPDKVLLALNRDWNITPNRNEVASAIGSYYAQLGLKTLIFVDTPRNCFSTLGKILSRIPDEDQNPVTFLDEDKTLLRMVETELGGRDCSFLPNTSFVGVHHGNMLPAERVLNERLFKRKQGLNIIIATATLAQGINLPAELVIISGDDRWDQNSGRRERIAPHELLNAAGRAGRAGIAAQGLVLVIPGEVVTLEGNKIKQNRWKLIKEVFSRSDQCLKVDDPLEFILDSLSVESDTLEENQQYIINRLYSTENQTMAPRAFFSNSFVSYKKSQLTDDAWLENRIAQLDGKSKEFWEDTDYPDWIKTISVNMGLPVELIDDLSNSIEDKGIESTFLFSIPDWLEWVKQWFEENPDRLGSFFPKPTTKRHFCKALGKKEDETEYEEIVKNFSSIIQLITHWISGLNLNKLDEEIPGRKDRHCGKARNFALKLIPELSFFFGLISLVVREKFTAEGGEPTEIPFTIRTLASCIREGFDSPEKLAFKYSNRNYSRVECHSRFSEEPASVDFKIDDYDSFGDYLNALRRD